MAPEIPEITISADDDAFDLPTYEETELDARYADPAAYVISVEELSSDSYNTNSSRQLRTSILERWLKGCKRWSNVFDNQNAMQVEIVVKPASTKISRCMHRYLISASVVIIIVALIHWALSTFLKLDTRIYAALYALEIILGSSILVVGTLFCCFVLSRGFKFEFRCLSSEDDHNELAGEWPSPSDGLTVLLPAQLVDFPPSYEQALACPVPRKTSHCDQSTNYNADHDNQSKLLRDGHDESNRD